MLRTPDPEVGGSSPTRVKSCCVLEQGTFTPQKVLVIPRKRWLRPNMTEKLFTGTLRIKSTNQHTVIKYYSVYGYVIRNLLDRRQKILDTRMNMKQKTYYDFVVSQARQSNFHRLKRNPCISSDTRSASNLSEIETGTHIIFLAHLSRRLLVSL